MALPVFQTSIQELSMMQTRWASQLNPVLNNPTTNPIVLKGVSLVTGVNVINTGLVSTLQGWIVSDINAAITVYRSAPKAPLTLTLTCSGPATADILVF